jgi:hypothetical protein
MGIISVKCDFCKIIHDNVQLIEEPNLIFSNPNTVNGLYSNTNTWLCLWCLYEKKIKKHSDALIILEKNYKEFLHYEPKPTKQTEE